MVDVRKVLSEKALIALRPKAHLREEQHASGLGVWASVLGSQQLSRPCRDGIWPIEAKPRMLQLELYDWDIADGLR
jgi:hypothetical protein